MTRGLALAAFAASFVPAPAPAQVTGTPIFQGPYRSFAHAAFGGTVSFPSTSDLALEGDLRVAASSLELGFRGGFLFPEGPDDAVFLFGAEAKQRILTHSDNFPADGSVVFGFGGNFGDGSETFLIPIALSFGRRLSVEDSRVTIVPFVQPTGWIAFGDLNEFLFSLGAGAEFDLTPVFDVRVSFGIGDLDGVSVSAIWTR